MNKLKVAVLGAGITGLSAAYHLSKAGVAVTLIESTHRVGGWVDTNTTSGHILETGPRSIRPVGVSGALTLSMIHELGLQSQLLTKSKTHPSARNRFILFNGELNKLPSSLFALLFNAPPVMKGVLTSIFKEPLVERNTTLKDESIHSFISRRLGVHVAENLVSAMVHGIYAGDIKKLSIKSTFKSMWHAEQEHGSLIKGLLKAPKVDLKLEQFTKNNECIKFIKETMKNSLYSFKNGLSVFSDALNAYLLKHNVRVALDTRIESIQLIRDAKPVITFSTSGVVEATEFDHVICTIPSFAAAKFNSLPKPIASLLEEIRFVDVVVMNIGIKSEVVLPVEGFGFLIPSTQNMGVLGVVLDSCTLPEQDHGVQRVTVMHKPRLSSDAAYREAAMSVLAKTLGVKETDIVFCEIRKHEKCIAQYDVGHEERVLAIKESVNGLGIEFCGSSYHGVSVNDCVYDGYNASKRLIELKSSQVQ